ncbi:MAG: hypothetical protein IKS45_03205 [Thermoguttaceae bacterium]|nr:hypothetical protein [Thermoguttaceae bacterium]MBR6435492.1 hypothetical protein [Thermoguttaceae bacterium]
MDLLFNFLAGVAQGVAAGFALSNWKENLRARIVQWCMQNRVELATVGVMLVDARQTANGTILLVRVMGMFPNGQVIHLDDVEAPYEIGEAIGVVYNGYPVNQPQELFNYNQLYAPFNN